MIGRILTITVHTFKESVREKVLYNLIAFALLLTAAALLFGSISLGVNQIMLVNLGLSSISVFGLLMAIFIGIGLVSKEIEKRTLYNILSKPVARFEFILGKWCGLLVTLLVNTSVMTAGFYVALYCEKRRLGPADLAPLEAVYFIVLELALVVAIALLFSCISTPVLAATFTFCLYVIGNVLAEIRGFGRESGSFLLEKITAVLFYLLPNFSNFQIIPRTAHGFGVPGYLIASNTLYTLLYATVLLSAAVLIFEEKEF